MKFSKLRESMISFLGKGGEISHEDQDTLLRIINGDAPSLDPAITPEVAKAIKQIMDSYFPGPTSEARLIDMTNFLYHHGNEAPLADKSLAEVANDKGPRNPIAKILAELYVQASSDPGGRFNSLERLGRIGDGVIGVTREAFVNVAMARAHTSIGKFILGRLAGRAFDHVDEAGVLDGVLGPPFLNAILAGGFQEGAMRTGSSLMEQLTADGGKWQPNLSGAQWSSSLERDPTVQSPSAAPSGPTVV